MKTSIQLCVALFICLNLNAQLKTPALSPFSSLKQTIGLTNVEIEYSRPSARGRVIFGENGILGYNEKWRLGANAATKITLSDGVKIMDSDIPAGSYALIAIPAIREWQILWFPYESSNWNSYLNKTPTFQIMVTSEKSVDYIETFEIHFEAIKYDAAVLVFEWEKIKLKLPFWVASKEQTLKNIQYVMSGPSNSDYFQAAVFLHETKEDLETALTYVQKITSSEDARFFQVTREAQILKDLGRSKEAKVAAKRALALSKEAANNDFVRLSQKILDAL